MTDKRFLKIPLEARYSLVKKHRKNGKSYSQIAKILNTKKSNVYFCYKNKKAKKSGPKNKVPQSKINEIANILWHMGSAELRFRFKSWNWSPSIVQKLILEECTDISRTQAWRIYKRHFEGMMDRIKNMRMKKPRPKNK